ncbi:MAG: MATE family efflux transporter [Lachnospiraceae bacterium]|nr:MATE family efflux transporter [Lachnospiraceae bacterium]
MSTQNARKKIDMTTGPIMRNIFLFAIPIVIGNILQQLYTTVDTLVIGNYCGHTSLAAVGTSSQPVEVLLCIFLGIGTGVSILISQYIGAKLPAKVKDCCATASSFVFLCGIPVGVLGWFLTPYILQFMGVPADARDAALIYTRLVFCGTLGNIGYNMNAGILRGLGDSKASLWFLVVSCIANIILDLTFVAGMGMDVRGAALATSIAMYLSWFVSVAYIKKKFPELGFTFLPKKLQRDELRRIIGIGLPIGLNNSLYSFGHMALQTLVNAQGSVFMAGASVAGRINGLAGIAVQALSSAATTFSGQNYGAKRFDRLREGRIMIPLANGIITFVFGMLLIGIRMPVLRIFNKDEMVLMYASRYVFVMLFSQWIYAIFNVMMCMVNGTGRVRYTTVVNILMLWAVRIPVASLINRYFDGTWVMISFPISFGFGLLCMIGYYLFSPGWRAILHQGNPRQPKQMPSRKMTLAKS